MRPICDDVYAEGELDAAAREQLTNDVNVATRNLEPYFGTGKSSPLVLFCQSAKCKLAFGASPAAASASDLGFASAQVLLEDGSLAPSAVVVTGPGPKTAKVLTHEWVHAEMKAWVAYDALPTWFNEGAATFIAGEPSCPAVNGPQGGELDVKRLKTKAIWQRHLADSGKTHETYCAARREVETWMQHFESVPLRAEALKTLLSAVAQGTSFDAAYRSL
jgi:hypothetical protein